MRRRTVERALVVIAILATAACSRKVDFTGNTADAQGQPSTQNQTPWATNGGEVARFPDEVPFGPEAMVARDKAPVRKSPGNGEVVSTLPSGTDVVKLSTHGSEDLICFDDPTSGNHMVGWIAQSALGDPTPTTPPTPTSPVADDAEPPPPSPSPSPSPSGGHHHKHPHGPKQH